jgi:hypothetical protein
VQPAERIHLDGGTELALVDLGAGMGEILDTLLVPPQAVPAW